MRIKSVLYLLFVFNSLLYSQENSVVLSELPDAVFETSGLIFHNGKLITHNDSGNSPQLFEIDTVSYQISRTITLSNAENVDWEDITQDENYIYLGDFGNNRGTRTNLTIYRISKTEYDRSDSVSAERIDFAYEDQTNFEDNGNSDWDAEALFVLNDQLVILTKRWQSNGTVAYSVPKIPGTYIAENIDFYAVDGLVTGATYNPFTNALFIIGYTQVLTPFVLRVEGVTNTSIFGGEIERVNINIGIAQTEAITYVMDTDTYFFSNERFNNASPPITSESRLFSFKVQNEENEEESEENEEEEQPDSSDPEEIEEIEREELILFKAFGSDILHYELNTEKSIFGQAIFDASGRRIQYIPAVAIEDNTIDLSTLGSTVYYLTLYLDDGVISKAFARN